MIIEIAVSIIALALLAGVIFSAAMLVHSRKILNAAKRDIHNVSVEAVDLMKKIDALVVDVKSKTDSLNFVFRPLKSIGKGKQKGETAETVSEIVEWVSVSLALFNKIKHAVKHREK